MGASYFSVWCITLLEEAEKSELLEINEPVLVLCSSAADASLYAPHLFHLYYVPYC